ncbi:MAG TPA: type IV pilus assembly protein PilM [Pyrinomonadaceae bacterium]|nr:type IV pilus assembly protein PilM [Pyrinomonadaceae bacterium]
MLKPSFGKKGLVGLDIGSSSVKAVELRGKPGNLQLVSLGYEKLLPDCVVDGQIIELNSVSHAINKIFKEHQIKNDRVAAGVSGHSVIVKNIEVPLMSDEELEESIDWHAEEHIPFDIADVSLDYQIVGSGPNALYVLMAACKRDRVGNVKQVIQLAGKSPTVIDVDSFALQNCFEVNYFPDPRQTLAILNIGASTMNINILLGTKSVFTRDVTIGGNQFTGLLQKELGLSFDQAEDVKRGQPAPGNVDLQEIESLLAASSETLALEVKKTLDFYRTTADENAGTVEKILITGGGSKLRDLEAFLSERLEMPVERFDPFRQIKVDNRRFDPDYIRELMPEMAVAVGLALRGVDA